MAMSGLRLALGAGKKQLKDGTRKHFKKPNKKPKNNLSFVPACLLLAQLVKMSGRSRCLPAGRLRLLCGLFARSGNYTWRTGTRIWKGTGQILRKGFAIGKRRLKRRIKG